MAFPRQRIAAPLSRGTAPWLSHHSRRLRPRTLAVLDIGLPGMDGYELARRLRAESSEPIALIALTGYGRERDRQQATEAGFDAHLVKPVSFDDLTAAVEQVLLETSGD